MNRHMNIELPWNDHGVPMVNIPDGAKVSVTIIDAKTKMQLTETDDLPMQFDEVVIAGNREGFVALATWLLAMSDIECNISHQHFDNETDLGFYYSSQNCWLTIRRLEDE
jgi:hypothetical protein